MAAREARPRAAGRGRPRGLRRSWRRYAPASRLDTVGEQPRRVIAADEQRGREERDAVHEPGAEEPGGESATALDEQRLDAARSERLQSGGRIVGVEPLDARWRVGARSRGRCAHRGGGGRSRASAEAAGRRPRRSRTTRSGWRSGRRIGSRAHAGRGRRRAQCRSPRQRRPSSRASRARAGGSPATRSTRSRRRGVAIFPSSDAANLSSTNGRPSTCHGRGTPHAGGGPRRSISPSAKSTSIRPREAARSRCR